MSHERIHMIMLILWSLATIPTLTLWRDSILWIAFMSLYANISGHWAAWEAARMSKPGPRVHWVRNTAYYPGDFIKRRRL